MELEGAGQDPLEVLLQGILSNLQGQAFQHLAEGADAVQHDRQDQLRLVAEMMVQRALGDLGRLRDVAGRDACEPARAEQTLRGADQAIFLAVHRRGSIVKRETDLSECSRIMSKRSNQVKHPSMNFS